VTTRPARPAATTSTSTAACGTTCRSRRDNGLTRLCFLNPEGAVISVPFPEPTAPAGSRAEVFLRYLDYFRSRLAGKLAALPEAELRRSALPSGWTPLELVKHLRYVELRWLEWGFEGREFANPWADNVDGRWAVGPEETLPGLLADLLGQAGRTRAIVGSHDLDQTGKPGDRWGGADPATLERILLHLLQEYARHLGQLDIVVEIATGQTGELFLPNGHRCPLPPRASIPPSAGLLRHALVHALAHALDEGAHHVAGPQVDRGLAGVAHPAGRAGGDQVAGP
jgi:hypothetical protein